MLDFLHPLPVDALWGVGERAAETLRRLGLTHRRRPGRGARSGMLRQALGEAAARRTCTSWPGAATRARVSPEQVEKSIGAETTFDVDVADPAVIRRTLLALGRRRSAPGCAAPGRSGRTVSIKVRLADFRTVSRSRTLDVPTDVAREIFDTAWALYTALDPGEPDPAGRRPGGGARAGDGRLAGSSPSASPSAAGARRRLPRTPPLPVSGGPS